MANSAHLKTERLARAGIEEFSSLDAGPRRRAAITAATFDHLTALWNEVSTDLRPGAGVALACTGSLARGDGGPLSDLDLIVVHDRRSISDGDLNALAERLWYPLWDCGIDLDHAVRSLAQCRQVAAADLNVTTALLNLQPVAGDAQVVGRIRKTLAEDWRKNSRARLPELVDSVTRRHEAVGDLAQLLAPDLKEARGGLRDMTVIRALAVSWLTDRPHGKVDAAYNELLDVRDAVQVVTGRSRSQLNLADQDEVAAMLGDADADALLTRVSLAGRVIASGLDATMRRARQSQQQRRRLHGPRAPQLQPLGGGLFVHDHEVVLGRGHDLADPTLPLRVAVAASAKVPISPTTVSNLAQHGAPLPTPWPAEARDLMVQLLGVGPDLVSIWEDLDQAGLISRWLPAWDAIRSRPQRNALHRHTVDRHSLEAVVQAAALCDRSPRPDVLLVATLLHDIGKVPGADDHSLVGAGLARDAAQSWGFAAADVDDITWLVTHHLTLAELATRSDPEDPQTSATLAAAAGGRPDLLQQLRLVTEADARAAGPKTWTAWRAALIDTLTEQTLASLSAAA